MEQRTHLPIAGEWVATEKALPVINPYDESVITEVPVATEAVVDAAIAAAEAGAADMRRLSARTRSAILARAAGLLSTGTVSVGRPSFLLLGVNAGLSEAKHGAARPHPGNPGTA